MSNITPYNQGEAARMRGKPFDSNPYFRPSKAVEWSLGWTEFEDHKKKLPPTMRKKFLAHLNSIKLRRKKYN